MPVDDPLPSPADDVTVARLRFLADAAIVALWDPKLVAQLREDERFQIVPATASEEMLRTLLGLAIPVLEASIHKELARQIREVLDQLAPV